MSVNSKLHFLRSGHALRHCSVQLSHHKRYLYVLRFSDCTVSEVRQFHDEVT